MWLRERLPGESLESRFQNHTRNFKCRIQTGKMNLSVRFRDLWMNDQRKLPVFSDTKLQLGICRGMTPQGLCMVKEHILISAYCGGREKPHPSIIYVMNWKGELQWIWELPFQAHVGGLTYDGRNLWVCSGGKTISAFGFQECLEISRKYAKQEVVLIKKAFRKKVTTDTTTSFCTYYNSRLWTGKFVAPPGYKGEPWIYGYPLCPGKGNTEVDIRENAKISVASMKHVQGICFAEFQGKKYFLLSKSYGKYFASYVEMYEYSSEEKLALEEQPLIRVKLPPMLEQIVVKDGKLYLLFESSADKFYKQGKAVGNCRFPVNRLCAVDFEQMLEVFAKNNA